VANPYSLSSKSS